MNHSKIEYLDLGWSPLVGCSGVDCAVRDHCFARGQMKRQLHRCKQCYDFTPHAHPERFGDPYRLNRLKKMNIGVGFSGDFFDKEFSRVFSASGSEQIQQLLLKIMSSTPHNYLILTKQPQNIFWPIPNNVAVGVSVNRKADLWRLNSLRNIHCSLRAVSFEPLLEDMGELDLSSFGWVIIGAQTRPEIQPNSEWVHDIIMQTYDIIPVFLKNNLIQHTLRQFPETWKKELT